MPDTRSPALLSAAETEREVLYDEQSSEFADHGDAHRSNPHLCHLRDAVGGTRVLRHGRGAGLGAQQDIGDRVHERAAGGCGKCCVFVCAR